MARSEVIRMQHIHPRLEAYEVERDIFTLVDVKHDGVLMTLPRETFTNIINSRLDDDSMMEVVKSINIMCAIDDIGANYNFPAAKLRAVDGSYLESRVPTDWPGFLPDNQDLMDGDS